MAARESSGIMRMGPAPQNGAAIHGVSSAPSPLRLHRQALALLLLLLFLLARLASAAEPVKPAEPLSPAACISTTPYWPVCERVVGSGACSRDSDCVPNTTCFPDNCVAGRKAKEGPGPICPAMVPNASVQRCLCLQGTCAAERVWRQPELLTIPLGPTGPAKKPMVIVTNLAGTTTDPGAVQVIRRAKGRITACAEQATRSQPQLAAEVHLGWTVNAGRVMNIQVLSSSVPGGPPDPLSTCLRQAVRSLRFGTDFSAEMEWGWSFSMPPPSEPTEGGTGGQGL